MKNKQKASLRISLVILSAILLGVVMKSPPKETYQTFLKSQEPVIFSKQANEDVRQVLCNAIDNAKENLFLRIYNLKETSIIASLTKQAENNLPITIHYQTFKTVENFPKTTNVTLEEHPKIERKLMHQKALSVDKKYAWLGSANYTFSSLILDSNLIIGIKSSELCNHIISNTSGILTVNKQPLQYFVLPADANKALFTVLQAINTAKKTIRVGMFALTHPEIIRALHEATLRGVTVDVIIDKSFKNNLVNQLSILNIKDFSFSVKTTPHKLHHKLGIIDRHTLITGSTNWSEAGFGLNDEDLMILQKLTKRQNQKLDKIWQDLVKSSKIASMEKEDVMKKQAA
ncbi:phospholipase D-like domain-containing protein [Chlamydia sp. 17-3921]|uniref:phospholipase D-like domain-containing protein n=1 Tax=Chlamydia sp. 17-3921 TaxID=2675798 RepID=UPI00191B10A9|nr:phospholipase D-like domain-containing protein [Chlamydia sp. 17-3921]